MAARYWVGGTAAWDATAGTKWALTNGGTGGQTVPTSADDVFFTALSGVVTVSITVTANCLSLNCTGFTGTVTGTASLNVYGDLVFAATMTWTQTNVVSFPATSGSYAITSAGKSFNVNLQLGISGAGSATWVLQDALVVLGTITQNNGTFTTNNYAVTASAFSSSNTAFRAINLGSSTVTLGFSGLNFSTSTNLVLNAGTSSVVMNSSGTLFHGGSRTFNDVSFTGTGTAAQTIQGANTFNNLSFIAQATASVNIVNFSAPQTINGTLSTTGTAGNRRVWLRSETYGIAQTLTINSAPSLTDADFRDVYVVGAAAPISGTRIGDLRGCSGITFSAPKTVYWNLAAGGAWSTNAWAATSGGSVSTDNFPLAQDTAIIGNTGLNVSATVSFNLDIPYTGTLDMSSRTSPMTFAMGTTVPNIYGNWINGSGTALTGSGAVTFVGRNTQTITSAGKSFAKITIDSYSGTVELADSLVVLNDFLTVTNGTFDTKNYAVAGITLSSSSTNVRGINLGSSTVTLSGAPVVFTTATNLTFNAGTSTILCSGSTITFAGGNQTFYDVEFTNVNSFVKTMQGANTFRNLSIVPPTLAGLITLSISANQTITGTLTVAGATAARRIFLRSDTLGTQRDLTVGTLAATDCDFRDIEILGAAAGSTPTRTGDCGGNAGITFPAPKTVYWNLAGAQNWSATGWAASSGGTPDINNLPLAQDTAVFDDVGAAGTVTANAAWNIGTLNASARTSAMTLAPSSSFIVYGNWALGTGITTGSNASNTALTFVGRGIQTLTSNGVTFNHSITVDNFSGTVQLADALTLASNRTLTLTSGTFDAVTYSVTLGLFDTVNSNIRALRMGSGTWTIGGTGVIWSATTTTNLTFYKGTANIVLSDTSATARDFRGGSLSYNKLTIGGATGTSTLTITGNNQFTELASTKTVAHTIALGTTTQTFGKWTATGTAGNVVTLTGTGVAHVIAGACTSGINYLAMGTIGFAATSPGEFYAGANSTGTAAVPVYRTAKPADSTRYWVGGTGNWSDTIRWSTSSGGGSGASVPRSHDDVVFNSASNATAYTATVNAVTGGIRCKALTIAGPASGNLTLAGTIALDGVHGNVTLPATGLTRSYTGNITLSGSTTGKTFTTNGVVLSNAITVNGVGCEWTLGSAINMGGNFFQLINGTLASANYSITGSGFGVSEHSTTLTLGSSSCTFSNPGPIYHSSGGSSKSLNFTFNSGTSSITFSGLNTQGWNSPITFYNVTLTNTSPGTITFSNANETYNNLTIAKPANPAMQIFVLRDNMNVNGTLTLPAGTDATRRHFLQSNTIGTTRTLTCAAMVATDVDFRDITIAGAAAPVSGTRLGDCKGNNGITFGVGVTRYWNLAAGGNWSAVGWAASSGASPAVNNFPLAQDAAIFQSTGLNSGATVTLDAAYNIGTIDMSARTTNTMTLTVSSNLTSYGNWINGTGTSVTSPSFITFAGRTTQTLTSAGKTFPQFFTVDSPNGSVVLQDAWVISSSAAAAALTITKGTLNANGYNVTLSAASTQGGIDSNTTNIRSINIGSGTWTISNAGGWSTPAATNLTVTGTGTISLTSASAKTFAGGGVSYAGVTLNQGGAGALTITGNNTFANISNSYKVTGATTIAMGATTQTVGNFTASGEAGRVLTVTGSSAVSPATLILTSGTVTMPDYLNIIGVRAYSLENTWYAGINSVNSGSLGWIFTAAAVVIATAVSTFFLMF